MDSFEYDSDEFRTHLQNSAHVRGEVTFLQSITEPGMTALDIGANRGVTTVALAKAVGPRGRVLAFEPVPEHFRVLEESLRRNRVSNVEAFEQGIIDRCGYVHLYVNGGGTGIVPSEDRTCVEAPTITVDDLIRNRGLQSLDVISSDCEGSELLAFRGAAQTLQRFKPRIFCEIHHSSLEALGHSAADVANFLEDMNFSVRPLKIEDANVTPSIDECSHIYAAHKSTAS